MKIGIKICLDKNFYQKNFYKEMFDKYVRFTPIWVSANNKKEEWSRSTHYKLFEKYKSGEILSVSNNDNESFITFLAGPDNNYRFIELVQDSARFEFSDADIESLVDFKELIACFLYNEEYEVVQSAISTSELKERNLPPEILATIRNTPTRIGFFNTTEYISSFNPGSSLILKNMELVVGWKMWYGEPFFEIIPKEKLLSFPYACEIKQLNKLNNEVVYVKLYDDIYKPFTPDNIYKQCKWKEWLDFEGLEKKYGFG